MFRTDWFSRAARKAGIKDCDLCLAIGQAMNGQADDLGGGVFKKRLKRNDYRSIILVKGGRYWIYEYLFAKSDRDNIAADELTAFRLLAKNYEQLSGQQVAHLMRDGGFTEICHADEDRV